jgi:hypothetical protein
MVRMIRLMRPSVNQPVKGWLVRPYAFSRHQRA